MSVEELWTIHEQIKNALRSKILAERRRLESHLSRLKSGLKKSDLLVLSDYRKVDTVPPVVKVRRPYPAVKAKYRNPKDPSITWSGRGKTPRWLLAELERGKTFEDFLIEHKAAGKRSRRR